MMVFKNFKILSLQLEEWYHLLVVVGNSHLNALECYLSNVRSITLQKIFVSMFSYSLMTFMMIDKITVVRLCYVTYHLH